MGRSSTGVLPASAGMILIIRWISLVKNCATRIRGDDPCRKTLLPLRPACSPHPRG